MTTQAESVEFDVRLSESAFRETDGEAFLFQAFQQTEEVFIVRCLILAVDDQVVSDVEGAIASTDDLGNNVLVLLRCRRYSKHHAFVAVEILVKGEGRDGTRCFVKLDLVEAPSTVDLRKHRAAVQPFQDLVDCRNRVTFPDDGFVGASHVHAQTYVAIGLGRDDNRTDPR